EVALAVPPVARARGLAAEAQDALIEPVELGAILTALLPLGCGLWRNRLEPGLNRRQLRIWYRKIRHQILYHRHVRQRVDLDLAADFIAALGAGKRVGAVDIHCARAADAFAARAAEGQRWVDVVLDVDQCIKHHRAAIVHIDIIDVGTRILVIIWRPAINLEGAHIGCAFRLRPDLAFSNLGVLGKGNLDHAILDQYTRALGAIFAGSMPPS